MLAPVSIVIGVVVLINTAVKCNAGADIEGGVRGQLTHS